MHFCHFEVHYFAYVYREKWNEGKLFPLELQWRLSGGFLEISAEVGG